MKRAGPNKAKINPGETSGVSPQCQMKAGRVRERNKKRHEHYPLAKRKRAEGTTEAVVQRRELGCSSVKRRETPNIMKMSCGVPLARQQVG